MITDGAIVNAGVIDVNRGTEFVGSLVLVNTGTIKIASAESLAIGSAGSSFTNTGTITGGGNLTIDDLTYTLNSNTTLSSSTYSLSVGTSGTANVTGTGTITVQNTLTAARGTISNQLIVDSGGTVRTETNNHMVLTGTITINSGGKLRIDGTSADAELNVTGPISNAGRIEFDSSGTAYADLDLETGQTLVNTATGTIHIMGNGTGGSSIFASHVVNAGTLDIDNDFLYQGGSRTFINTGAIDIAASKSFTFGGTGDQLVFNPGTTLAGTGTLKIVAEATLSINYAAIFSTMQLDVGSLGSGSSTVNGTGSILLNSMLAAQRGTITVPISIATGGNLLAEQNNLMTLTGTVTIAAGGSLTVNANGAAAELNITAPGGLTNAGAARLTSATGHNSTLDLTGVGTFVNSAGGTVSFDVGGGGLRFLTGANIQNAVVFDVNTNSSVTVGVGSITLNNTGTIDIAASTTLTLVNTAFVNSGTLTGAGSLELGTGSSVALGAQLDVIGRTFTLGGGSAFNGNGHTVNVDSGGRLTVNTSLITQSGSGVLLKVGAGASATVDGTGTITIRNTPTFARGTVGANVAIDSTGVISMVASNNLFTFSGCVTNNAGGTIQLQGTNADQTDVNFTGTLINHGTIVMTASVSVANVTLDLGSTGSLTNMSGGVIRTSVGSSGARTITAGNLTNNSGGLIDIDQNTTYSGGFTLSNAGAIDIASGQTFTISGASTTLTHNSGATLLGAGTLHVTSSATLNAAAALTIGSGLSLTLGVAGVGSGTLSGAGTVTNAGTINAQQGTQSGALINDSGGLIKSTASNDIFTFSGCVTNNANGTIQLEGTNVSHTDLNFTGTLINHGTIVMTASVGTSNVTLDLGGGGSMTNASTGVLSVLNGTGGLRVFNGLMSNAGTISVGSSAQLQVTGASTTITSNTGATYQGAGSLLFGPSTTWTIAGASTIAAGHNLYLSTQGSGNVTVNGSGVLTNAGTLHTRQGTYSANLVNDAGGTVLAQATNDIFTFSGCVTNNAGGTIQLEGTNVSHTDVNFTGALINHGTIVMTTSVGSSDVTLDAPGVTINNASGAVINVNTGTGGSRTINAGISNTGTINFNTSATLNIGAINFNNNSGGQFTVASGVTVNIQDDNNPARTFANAGSLTVNSAGTLIMNGTDISNTGDIVVNGAIYMGDGPGGSAVGGGDVTNGGNIVGSGFISLEGGTFTGNATGVTINPGNSPGKLTIDGAVVFTNNSKLVIELGGRKAVEEYDQLAVTGRYALAGTLAVAAYGAFAAAASDNFDVVQYGSRTGMFHEITGLDQYDGVAIDPVFTDTGITLNARAITMDGTGSNDMLAGTDDDDALVGRDGDDVLSDGLGSDLLLGGGGNDVLKGGAGDDRLIGGEGRDTADYRDAASAVSVDLSQGSATGAAIGADTLVSVENLIGSAAVDTLVGNDRDNVLDGRGGKDVLTGGAGRDTFVVGARADAGDSITDFVSGEDRLEIDAVAYALSESSLMAGRNFSVIGGSYDGASAGDNSAFAAKQATFVYSSADHALYYDSNGSDPGGYSVVVTLQPNAALLATDIHLMTQVAA